MHKKVVTIEGKLICQRKLERKIKKQKQKQKQKESLGHLERKASSPHLRWKCDCIQK